MKKFAFLGILVISSFASLFSHAETKAQSLADLSFATFKIGTDSSDLATITTLQIRFNINVFRLPGGDYFSKHFNVVAAFSADVSIDTYDKTTGEFKFSLVNPFCTLSVFSTRADRSPFATVLAAIFLMQ